MPLSVPSRRCNLRVWQCRSGGEEHMLEPSWHFPDQISSSLEATPTRRASAGSLTTLKVEHLTNPHLPPWQDHPSAGAGGSRETFRFNKRKNVLVRVKLMGIWRENCDPLKLLYGSLILVHETTESIICGFVLWNCEKIILAIGEGSDLKEEVRMCKVAGEL